MTGITEAIWDDVIQGIRPIKAHPTHNQRQLKANRNKVDQRIIKKYQRLLTDQHLSASHLRSAICAILPLSQQSASAVAFTQNERADM